MDTGETFPHGAQQCRMKNYRAQANVSDWVNTEAETLQMRLDYTVINEFLLWKQ